MLFCPADICLQYAGVVIGKDPSVEQVQLGDNNRWSVWIVHYLFRMEQGDAVDAAEIHLSVCCPAMGIVGELVALKPVVVRIIAEFLCFGLETAQSFVGT